MARVCLLLLLVLPLIQPHSIKHTVFEASVEQVNNVTKLRWIPGSGKGFGEVAAEISIYNPAYCSPLKVTVLVIALSLLVLVCCFLACLRPTKSYRIVEGPRMRVKFERIVEAKVIA